MHPGRPGVRKIRHLGPADVPSKPDPTTGLPVPPRAPGVSSSGERDRGRETNPDRAPAPPDGQGPVLAWYKPSQRGSVAFAAGVTVVIVVGLTLAQGFSMAWMSFWSAWAIILATGALAYGAHRRIEVSAGAQWLQRRPDQWVRTYELTRIVGRQRLTSISVQLTDRDERRVTISSRDLQADRRIWDYAYNGIVHSVIVGRAHTNGLLHSALDIPRPNSTPALGTDNAHPAGSSYLVHIAALGLMILGFVWLGIDYLAGDRIDFWGGWEFLIGFALMVIGLIMDKFRH